MFTQDVSGPVKTAYRLRHMACALDAIELLPPSEEGCPESKKTQDNFSGQALGLVTLCMGAGTLLLSLMQI